LRKRVFILGPAACLLILLAGCGPIGDETIREQEVLIQHLGGMEYRVWADCDFTPKQVDGVDAALMWRAGNSTRIWLDPRYDQASVLHAVRQRALAKCGGA